ncbi:molybdopterin-dependent oxidoreductase [Hymenobacter nivis]|uniref:Molybdopterin-binding oxidoreductase n=1 Tax=Hymenobacter nivis TaxID=1850093 RepID=A0A502HBZ9_9BACT|nr:molybdopterin-dependent oxidoreductase [Hymenobacter nivis]TPG72187.1 molybdopterin-binding oxidoreductase [Hymenobacter nivis]
MDNTTDYSAPPLPESPAGLPEADVARQAASRSRRAFIIGGVAALAGVGGWRWLLTRPADEGTPWPFRRVLDANGRLSQAYFRETRLAPTFPKSMATFRQNGNIGLKDSFVTADWRMRVQAYAPAGAPARVQEFTIDDIKALPRVDMTTELKCIEGWSIKVNWVGARFSDFLEKYPLATANGKEARYVSLVTPDEKYYVGLDLSNAVHPQTLLCYEMNGQPLTGPHGAPLRLVTPLKYGIKHLKRIGTIAFVDERPADFWAEQGYDWDSGH